MSERNQLRRQFILDLKEEQRDIAVKPPEVELFIKRMGDMPEEYRYGGKDAIMALWLEGGYPTPEEAIAAYVKEQGII
jgi:hypothetical protein